MFRHTLALVGILVVSSPGWASWADRVFAEVSKDFGTVPRGPMLSHPFHIHNQTGAHIRISNVRVSCGCVTAVAPKSYLAPGQESIVMVKMDTRRFSGVKNVTIYVSFDQPSREEVRLWIQANSRNDVTITPDSFDFGQVKRAGTPSRTVDLTFQGNRRLQITGVRCESNYVHTRLDEVHRGFSQVHYRLTAQLRLDAPVGKWYTDVWLSTNNPASPRVRIPLTVEIESNLTVSPSILDLGQVKVGSRAERKVIVRGVEPFKITGVEGVDKQVSVRGTSTSKRLVHVLTISINADKPGSWQKPLRIKTDLKEESQIGLFTRAEIVP